MRRNVRWVPVLALAFWAGQGATARAQWGYPVGFGMCGWGGWGVDTPEGSLARGMGAYAAGAGFYNKSTAIADSINADTIMRFNEYIYESNKEANRQYQARKAGQSARTNAELDKIQARLRDNPEQRDFFAGDALNVAVDEIDDPRVYGRALQGAKVKIGGDTIRDIPFRYAPGAITVSIQRLTKEPPPKGLLAQEFDADRAALKAAGQEIRKDLDTGDRPRSENIAKARAVINAAEARAEKLLPRNTRDRNDVDRYLKALHGLIGMLETPALEVILSGVDKRPEATLGELLKFMDAFNLRFGQATTPRQRTIYKELYPKLVALRDEVAPILASTRPHQVEAAAVGDFFSKMDYRDLQKKAPPPPGSSSGVSK
jgi:hypothetical protein